jgi:hypothetical protein
MVNTDGGEIEGVLFITASLDCMRLGPDLTTLPMTLATFEEVCGLDDGSVAVTLDDLEVRPILCDHVCCPPSSADGNQNVERQTLRRARRQRS